MKLILRLCLGALLAAMTSADYRSAHRKPTSATRRQPPRDSFKSYLIGKIQNIDSKVDEVVDKVEELEAKFEAIDDLSSCTYKSETKEHGTFFPATDGINWCWCNNGSHECTTINGDIMTLLDALVYNYRDTLAQAYCASLRQNRHVFAIRRDCANVSVNTATCDDLCGSSSVFNANLTTYIPSLAGATECFDALWFWTAHPTLEPNPSLLQPDAGEINMGTYSYGPSGCYLHANMCGPNYCCCSHSYL